ncbi:GSCFA domain-containing protein [Aquimarina sp. ERC-38]|uniref:GSCFA domain-containing protein n=1 Tax=Aquimarina sp. ERC-38 TaxID=2949996 RepID=UPI002246FD04|nr:GSCFA domain-containing protein [Aquimarina sp. ERC-38]UZO82432.1 GSCFA domain-containing protein [Aquimarina sp. ERC-38]
MKLYTQVPLQDQNPKISYHDNMVLLGSCFVENIAEKLSYFKFRHILNPFGILFHPKAIETLLWMAVNKERYTKEDLFQYNNLWHSFDAHSSLSHAEDYKVLSNLNTGASNLFSALQNANYIFITLGTAWVYQLKSIDLIVANCHKIPASEFEKKLLSVNDLVSSLYNSIELIRQANPTCNIIFTVSPVRHVKDGVIENSRSKSHLVTAVHTVLEEDKNINYFPSYEILMDELRDYRFYKQDLLHPNETAIQIIWERLVATWFSKEVQHEIKEVDSIQKGLLHRPFHEESEQHQKFKTDLQNKIASIQQKFPFMKFENEIDN